MTDLIERNKALLGTWREPRYTDPLNVLTEVRDRIRALPAVDAVPVVRCKNCKMFYMKKDTFGKVPWCKAWRRGTIETMFCGWGKRKEELRSGKS